MTRPSLKDKEIGDELLQDIGRYRDYCKKLVCFIYDKNSYLANPHGIIKDLETHSTDEMQVKVYIAP